jgi:hypothetical protein
MAYTNKLQRKSTHYGCLTLFNAKYIIPIKAIIIMKIDAVGYWFIISIIFTPLSAVYPCNSLLSE